MPRADRHVTLAPSTHALTTKHPTRMRLGIKGKQVLGVTSIVGAVVVILSLLHLARLGQRGARGEPCSRRTARQRDLPPCPGSGERGRRSVLMPLRADSGLRAILESNVYSKNMIFAAIVDVRGLTVVSSLEDQPLPPGNDLMTRAGAAGALAAGDRFTPARAATFEYRQPLLLGGIEFDRSASACRRCSCATISTCRSGRLLPPRSPRSASRSSSPPCSRSCCCGRFTSSGAA